ncbi:DUF2971 domain-containing protein [Pseudomonas putida]|uniref:DUF2971 domain-containing protein n=1 Tax=Pseudomonas putida TaxID=303 RepID=UPI0009A1D9F9|nr:DUF2971 domain-containing protein [Pseudomonas putida]
MADSLYHYTDAGAVKSILELKELWMTDIRFLNDSQELNDGVVFVIDALDIVAQEFSDGDEFALKAIRELKSGFDSHVSDWINDEPIFVCSFSEAGDQLSQWRAYGSYAIEFDSDRLVEKLGLFDCVYDREKKIEFAFEAVKDSVHGLADDLRRYGDELPLKSLEYLSILVRTASIFKNEHFYEEREVRCALDLQIPSSKLQFRQRGGLLVPYTPVSFSYESIKAIHVGPMRDQDLAFTAMKAFVSNIESVIYAKAEGEHHKVRVVQSKIPYRAP